MKDYVDIGNLDLFFFFIIIFFNRCLFCLVKVDILLMEVLDLFLLEIFRLFFLMSFLDIFTGPEMI